MPGDESDSSIGSVDDPEVVKKGSKKRTADESGDDKEKSSKKKVKYQKNSDGDEMIPLGKNKYVTVREFRGIALVDIREYFEKDGKMLPGKKGISLTREQYAGLKELLPEIDAKINEL